MQYMGGKSRIARSIAEIINEIPRWKIKNCQTHCSDNHAGCGGGIAIVQLAVENHPQDSRVKINEDGVVQTLSGQMGTGGDVPLILENK